MRSKSFRLSLGQIAFLFLAGTGTAGCVHDHEHDRDHDHARDILITDDHGYDHDGYYDEDHHWHGGYYDENKSFHADPANWRDPGMKPN